MTKQATARHDLLKSVQKRVEIAYDKVSMEALNAVITQYEEEVMKRVADGERILTKLGVIFAKFVPARKKGTIYTNYESIPARYLPKIKFKAEFRNNVRNLPVDNVEAESV